MVTMEKFMAHKKLLIHFIIKKQNKKFMITTRKIFFQKNEKDGDRETYMSM